MKLQSTGDSTHDFEALANRHKDAVYRQMLRVCGNHEDAEDVLVEALFKAYRKMEQLRDSEAFRAWLGRIANRVCLRIRERESLAPLLHLAEMEALGLEPAGVTVPQDEVMARSQLKAVLTTAIASLPKQAREVYELREIEELSGEEVTRRLGISLAAMKSRLYRARTLLRKRLDADFTKSLDANRKGTSDVGSQC
jgi:RNA polymerase sigma-70 factor (ECF subfamily)